MSGDDTANRASLSVVMPVYNEAVVIAGVVDAVQREVLDRVDGAELIIVDDRGTDGSSAILERLAVADQRITLIRNDHNVGHGRSVRRGLDAATGEWLLQLDSDGQLDVTDFATMWARMRDADLIVGVRTDRDDPWHRLALTKAVNLLVSVLARRRVRDANAGFKLIRRSLYEHLRPSIPERTFAPSLLLVVGAYRSGARVANVGVTHRARVGGASSLHARRLVAAVATATAQTLRYAITPVSPYRHG
jgi:glycosyltransferase involved in cell wall biosynthesis